MLMSKITLFAGLIIVVAALYSSYVSVITKRNNLLEAKSGIDVQFKKRYDLIPNVLTIAKRFMEHETEVFTQLTELRVAAMNCKQGSNDSIKLNAEIDSLISKLMVNVENYPELKSDSTMIQSIQTYNEVEEHIAAARRFYNSAVKDLKNAVMIFPSSLFKGYAADVIDSDFYECANEEKSAIAASKYL